MSLKEIMIEAKNTINDLFKEDKYIKELDEIIDKAIELSENDDCDLENILRLGNGWFAEETLAIAIYCSLRYQNDFSKGIIAAVNHNGDSNSTGAVTGNILGAYLGFAAIEEKWKKNLELYDLIDEMALDICHGCLMSEGGSYKDDIWSTKYIYMRWPKTLTDRECIFFWKENEENGYLSNWYESKFVIDDFEYLHVEQYVMAQKAKFEQNDELKQKLLSTGNAILAEANPWDDYWGIGIDAATAKRMDIFKWPGCGMLGVILMEVRKEISGQNISNTNYSSSYFDLKHALNHGL